MKNCKKIILSLFLFSFIFSETVLENRAINVAENFYYYKNDPRNSDFNFDSINQFSDNNNNIFYVINLTPSGFILIASDDLIWPILGYSFENEFRLDNIPTNIRYLFNLYNQELIELQELNRNNTGINEEWEKYSQPLEYEGQHRNVSPLIDARFNQDSPWNDMCPEDSAGPGGNVYVGCVAVCMAQIMHYWSYPEIGYGSHGYNHWDYGYQSANFGNAFYDYSNMPNTSATTETQELR